MSQALFFACRFMHFAGYEDRFVLIGGTAAHLAMEQFGVDFRATRDLDIVLHIEARDAEFGAAFWRFVEEGCYERREVGHKPRFYRFSHPATPGFPSMLELFSRTPVGLELHEDQRVVPIPVGEELASLSALLLDDEYYEVILATSQRALGIAWVDQNGLIPLKANAWLDLKARKAQNPESVDSRNVVKHLRDVLRLSQLLVETARIELPQRIRQDLKTFIRQAAKEEAEQAGQGAPMQLALARIAKVFSL